MQDVETGPTAAGLLHQLNRASNVVLLQGPEQQLLRSPPATDEGSADAAARTLLSKKDISTYIQLTCLWPECAACRAGLATTKRACRRSKKLWFHASHACLFHSNFSVRLIERRIGIETCMC